MKPESIQEHYTLPQQLNDQSHSRRVWSICWLYQVWTIQEDIVWHIALKEIVFCMVNTWWTNEDRILTLLILVVFLVGQFSLLLDCFLFRTFLCNDQNQTDCKDNQDIFESHVSRKRMFFSKLQYLLQYCFANNSDGELLLCLRLSLSHVTLMDRKWQQKHWRWRRETLISIWRRSIMSTFENDKQESTTWYFDHLFWRDWLYETRLDLCAQ